MNQCSFTGRLARDGAEKMAGSGIHMAVFTMVVDEQAKKPRILYLDCVLFGDKAKDLAPFLKKGAPVFATGSVWESAYKNKSGVLVKKLEMKATEVKIMNGMEDASLKAGKGESDGNPPEEEGAPSESADEAPKEEPKNGEPVDSGVEAGTDNLPF